MMAQIRYPAAMLHNPDNLRSQSSGELSVAQCRMAGAALNLDVREFAGAASVSTNTISGLERGEALLSRTQAAIRSALQTAGVEFIAENGGGPGVRLARR
jgi:transcriptional regulator with XRE-family HTH domain